MRKGPIIFAAAILVLLVYAVRSVFTLLTLLVDDGRARDAIQHAEIPMPNSAALLDGRPQLIPKIIHQTWVNTSIPAHWRAPQQSCLDLHQDYEYKVSLFPALRPSPPVLPPSMVFLLGTAGAC